jgi:hypothetical protein
MLPMLQLDLNAVLKDCLPIERSKHLCLPPC